MGRLESLEVPVRFSWRLVIGPAERVLGVSLREPVRLDGSPPSRLNSTNKFYTQSIHETTLNCSYPIRAGVIVQNARSRFEPIQGEAITRWRKSGGGVPSS